MCRQKTLLSLINFYSSSFSSLFLFPSSSYSVIRLTSVVQACIPLYLWSLPISKVCLCLHSLCLLSQSATYRESDKIVIYMAEGAESVAISIEICRYFTHMKSHLQPVHYDISSGINRGPHTLQLQHSSFRCAFLFIKILGILSFFINFLLKLRRNILITHWAPSFC